jgi:replication initiator protein RepSA
VTGSTRTPVPEKQFSGTGAYAEPTLFDPTPGGDDRYWPWAQPTKPVPPPGPRVMEDPTVLARTTTLDYDDWLGHVRAASACRHPIRLEGEIHVNNRKGQRIATYHTADMPDGVIYTPCGNRRASRCPACAEVYRRDTYQLVKAGLEGGRWGIPPLHDHIALFVTATAPSFGRVHHRVVETHAADCRRKDGCSCRAKMCHPFGRPCPHGVPTACRQRHKTNETVLGQPLCLDCYDHAGQVVWHHQATELWRRTIQQIDREIQRLARTHGVQLRRRFFKVYEFQTRAAIHYHMLLRLDGYHPDCPDAIVPPPAVVTRTMLETAVRAAFVKTSFTSPPHPANGGKGWRIAWGDPTNKGVDIVHVNAPGGPVNLKLFTGYIAKYVTKGTEVTGLDVRRVDDLVLAQLDPNTHTGRLVRACWELGAQPGWERLRRYAHQYGYGGHIASKSRGFSVTLTFQRRERLIWQRTQGHPHTWDDEQADLVITELGYHATGWITTGDALLANTSADLARAWHDNATYADPTDPDTTITVFPVAA